MTSPCQRALLLYSWNSSGPCQGAHCHVHTVLGLSSECLVNVSSPFLPSNAPRPTLKQINPNYGQVLPGASFSRSHLFHGRRPGANFEHVVPPMPFPLPNPDFLVYWSIYPSSSVLPDLWVTLLLQAPLTWAGRLVFSFSTPALPPDAQHASAR